MQGVIRSGSGFNLKVYNQGQIFTLGERRRRAVAKFRVLVKDLQESYKGTLSGKSLVSGH
jgi:hypothetical protein